MLAEIQNGHSGQRYFVLELNCLAMFSVRIEICLEHFKEILTFT